MNMNLTLIGQAISFAIFVWFCLKYVWPPILKALEERETRIADGLAAAERGKHELELAEQRATDLMRVSFGDVNKQDPRTVDALLDTYTIRDVMQEDILTVKPDDTVRTAAEHLARGDFHSLPVVGDDDELLGLVTSTDLIKYLLDQY